MKIITDIEFTKDLLKEIKNSFPYRNTQVESQLFYKDQIPLSGFFLEKGKVILKKNRNNIIEVHPYSFFALNECLSNKPSNFDAKILENSVVYFLDKSTIKEILEKKDSKLTNYLENILGSKQ